MPGRVLIVDDDEGFLITTKQLVELNGHQALVASTYEEGRQLLRSAAPDLLVADVGLGAFNGLQLIATAALKIPVIVVSGLDDADLQAEARAMGADYLVKPFPPEDLLNRIERKLSGTAGGSAESPERPSA